MTRDDPADGQLLRQGCSGVICECECPRSVYCCGKQCYPVEPERHSQSTLLGWVGTTRTVALKELVDASSRSAHRRGLVEIRHVATILLYYWYGGTACSGDPDLARSTSRLKDTRARSSKYDTIYRGVYRAACDTSLANVTRHRPSFLPLARDP